MGITADFYIGRGEKAKYIGSCGMDGHPKWMPARLLTATNEYEFREGFASLTPDYKPWNDLSFGWPWSWPDSSYTDFNYALDEGRVYVSCGDAGWVQATSFDFANSGLDDFPYHLIQGPNDVAFPGERTILHRLGLTKKETEKRKRLHDEAVFARLWDKMNRDGEEREVIETDKAEQLQLAV